MSGLVDFDTVSPVADMPLEEETGVGWERDRTWAWRGEGVAFAIADSDAVEKES